MLDILDGYDQVSGNNNNDIWVIPLNFVDAKKIVGKVSSLLKGIEAKSKASQFNIVTDEELREMKESRNNMDDVLLGQKNYKLLEPLINKVLSICRKKNLKLNPNKFKIGPEVGFGGTNIRYSEANRRVQITPSEKKVEELIGRDPPKTKKELQSILGSLNQLSAWIPQIKCHISLMRKLSGGNNTFTQSEQLIEEFHLMKRYLKKTVILSPLEVGREIHLHTDASNNGLGYILSQPHKDVKENEKENYSVKPNIITLGSAGLTETQQRYSSGEQECLAVLYAIQKTDHYVRGASEIKVFTDNKNLRDYFSMNLSDIKNERILKFREKLLGFNLKIIHIKGSTHNIADRLSRYSEEEKSSIDLEERFAPTVCSKSLRTMQVEENPKDYHLDRIAKLGKEDMDYSYMVRAISDKIDTKEIKSDSKLKKIEGQYESLSLYQTDEGEIIIRDGQEILIPQNYREEMLRELHSSHLSDTSMINLAKGTMYWPGIKEDLKLTYKSCNECLTNAISKPSSSYDIIPASLELLQPNEVIHMDYLEIGTTNILTIKCKATGWNWARITPNKTVETTIKKFYQYITTFDRPRLVVSDHGPAFSNGFVEFLHSYNINHHYSSSYRPQSNGPAERTVRSIKDVLLKIPEFNEKHLRSAVFAVNQHQSPDKSGSPSERFFKRNIRTNLPKIITKELKQEDLMKIRAEKQLKLAKKKGTRSLESFEEGDSVRIQNAASGRWDKSGTIKEARLSDDGQSVSFITSLPNGIETIWHRNHLRHNINRYTKMSETKVKFNLGNNSDSDERDMPKKPDIVKPIRLQKVNSDVDSETWKISSAESSAEENNEGIATRTRSRLNMSDQKRKSALKQRPL